MHRSSLVRNLFVTLSCVGIVLPFVPLRAATLGSLIKGPSDAVYYLGQNGKRYVFPTERAYKTWYVDFSQVKTISASELASYPIGGNVTYKPGSKLVKITTDPKVYAVSTGGKLRWVKTETAAQSLYGTDWNTKVDDIPDAFFVNYVIGTEISTSADFSPQNVSNIATSIDTDIDARTPTPAAPSTPTTPIPSTPTSTQTDFTFTASKQTLQGGDVVLLTGIAQVPAGITKIELFADTELIKLCTHTSCTGEFTVPLSGTKTSYTFTGKLTRLDTTVVNKYISLPVQSNGSNKVTLAVGQASILPTQLASVVVDISPDIAITRVDISVGGIEVKSCATGARTCSWADYIQNATLGTSYPVFAKVTDTLGRIYQSKTSSITISANDSPSVTIQAAKASAYIGEVMEATATAGDNDGITAIEILLDGIVVKHCSSSLPCSALVGPFSTTGMHELMGKALDAKGVWGITANPTFFEIINP